MKALIIVDVQNDFCPGGSLAVKDGDDVVPVINDLLESNFFDLVIATRDWHPRVTPHFDQWPVHCVAETEGAEYHSDLNIELVDVHVLKGTEENDGYSGFDATHEEKTVFENGSEDSLVPKATLKAVEMQGELVDVLDEHAIDEVYVVGLATDYCVKETALDAAAFDFDTFVISDAIRGVNLNKGDVHEALEAMREAGITLITTEGFYQEINSTPFNEYDEYGGYEKIGNGNGHEYADEGF